MTKATNIHASEIVKRSSTVRLNACSYPNILFNRIHGYIWCLKVLVVVLGLKMTMLATFYSLRNKKCYCCFKKNKVFILTLQYNN